MTLPQSSVLRPVLFLLLSFLVSNCSQDPFPVVKIYHDGPVGWKEKGACEIVYCSNGDSIVIPAHIKCRGGISSRYFKHSYSVEFDHKISFGDIPADDDWVFNANYIDKTFMRHKMSYDLFMQMGELNLASRSYYMNLVLNTKPKGLYLAMEEVNAAMVGLDKSDTMAMLFKDPPVYYKEKRDKVQGPNNYYQQKYPKKQKSDKTWYLENFINFMFNSSDSMILADAGHWIEMQNLIDWHLLLLFSNNGDGVMKNFLLYKLDSHTPFRIALWDYDHSFGRDGGYTLNMMTDAGEPKRAEIIRRLMEIPGSWYPEMLRDRWWHLRKANILSYGNIQMHLKQNNRIIREQIPGNAEIWPLNSKWYHDDNSYEEEKQLILDFVTLRIAQLDEYFQRSKEK
jgi:CotH kinase protein